jgi:hypothetical protein
MNALSAPASHRLPIVIAALGAELGEKATFIPSLYDDFATQTHPSTTNVNEDIPRAER